MQAYQKKKNFRAHDHSFRINYTFGMVFIQTVTVMAICVNNSIVSEHNIHLNVMELIQVFFLKDGMKDDH
jgi:hypothetical protein